MSTNYHLKRSRSVVSFSVGGFGRVRRSVGMSKVERPHSAVFPYLTQPTTLRALPPLPFAQFPPPAVSISFVGRVRRGRSKSKVESRKPPFRHPPLPFPSLDLTSTSSHALHPISTCRVLGFVCRSRYRRLVGVRRSGYVGVGRKSKVENLHPSPSPTHPIPSQDPTSPSTQSSTSSQSSHSPERLHAGNQMAARCRGDSG